MSLNALAPDQRAVVQLVLQQERSYDDLAELLGITSDAVRARAHAGLERLAPASDLDDDERADLADYLLAQQSVSKREAVRSLLAASFEAREWARTVSEALRQGVPSAALPEIPDETRGAGGPTLDLLADRGTPEPVPADELDLAEPEPATEPEPAPVAPAPRPRPRPETGRARPAPERREKPRSSLIGGGLLIGGLAIVLAALVVWLFTSGDDGDDAAGPSPTPTRTAEPTLQPAGVVNLRSPEGGRSRGQMVILLSREGDVTFNIGAENVPQTREGEAYAVWLVGGERPRRLGFAPPVGKEGILATSGPREGDAERFPQWFSEARQVVVSRETTGEATQPGTIVLRGRIPGSGSGS